MGCHEHKGHGMLTSVEDPVAELSSLLISVISLNIVGVQENFREVAYMPACLSTQNYASKPEACQFPLLHQLLQKQVPEEMRALKSKFHVVVRHPQSDSTHALCFASRHFDQSLMSKQQTNTKRCLGTPFVYQYLDAVSGLFESLPTCSCFYYNGQPAVGTRMRKQSNIGHMAVEHI